MAISPHCDFCGDDLEQFGGLLFSPPDKNGLVKKFHLCTSCYKEKTKKYF